MVSELVLIIVILALTFDFINGFHDSSNAISTIVATKTLRPVSAVTLGAIGNFVGIVLFPPAIATTIGKGIVTPASISVMVVLAAIIGAIVWNLITWYLGIPSSSSHALIGGLIGAVIAAGNPQAIILPTHDEMVTLLGYSLLGGILGLIMIFLIACILRERMTGGIGLTGFFTGMISAIMIIMLLRVVHISGLIAVMIFIVVSPMIGMGLSFLIVSIITRAFSHSHRERANRYFRGMQVFSSFFYSVAHGTNDAQKTMGIITVLLVLDGVIPSFEVPLWVMVAAHAAMSLGTFFGGWRIVKTMAYRLTVLRPYQGFSAETGGGVGLTVMAFLGIPVSTTHAIAGSIMGVGAAKGTRLVRWGVTKKIFLAWILTIPASALISAISFLIIGIL